MAKCPTCLSSVPNTAAVCPICKSPLPPPKPKKGIPPVVIISIICCLVFFGFWVWVIAYNIQHPDKVADDPEPVQEVTEESLFYDSCGSGKYENLDIMKTSDNGLKVVFHVPEFFNESALLSDVFSDYVTYSKAIYEKYDYDYISFSVFLTATDAKGNQSDVNALGFAMDRPEFETYTWENLKYTSIYDSFRNSCSSFDISIALESGVNPSKVYYTGD